MFKRLKEKFTRCLTRVELRNFTWFDCEGAYTVDANVKQGRKYIVFPDGLRLIIEDGKYVGFYTQHPQV